MSSPSYPRAKRRRLDIANSALNRPFRSPLKNQSRSCEEAVIHTSPPARETGSSENTTTQLSATSSTADNGSGIYTPRPAQRNKGRISPVKKFSPSKLPESPEYYALHTHYTSLLAPLSSLKSQLDTATHALRIEAKAQDQELKDLISKWKLASREAATLVFEAAREKVEKMGGIRAWRERERESRLGGGRMGNWGWDDEQGKRDGGDEEEEVDGRVEREGEERVAEGKVEEEDDVSGPRYRDSVLTANGGVYRSSQWRRCSRA